VKDPKPFKAPSSLPLSTQHTKRSLWRVWSRNA